MASVAVCEGSFLRVEPSVEKGGELALGAVADQVVVQPGDYLRKGEQGPAHSLGPKKRMRSGHEQGGCYPLAADVAYEEIDAALGMCNAVVVIPGHHPGRETPSQHGNAAALREGNREEHPLDLPGYGDVPLKPLLFLFLFKEFLQRVGHPVEG